LELRANLDRRDDVHIHAVPILKLDFDYDIFFVVNDALTCSRQSRLSVLWGALGVEGKKGK